MVFNRLEHERQHNSNVNLFVSFYEIYNEKIYDLLCKKAVKLSQTRVN